MKLYDEYEWPTYTKTYANAYFTDGKTIDYIAKTVKIDNGVINWGTDNTDTHAKELFSEILQLKPKNVFECGCGPGHNLLNISKLFPSIKVGGMELLKTQVEFGNKIWNIPVEFSNAILLGDMTLPVTDELTNQYEFVYSLAVIMHLKTSSAIEFLHNMMKISSKYIFLIEGFPNHDWIELFNMSGILEKFKYTQYIGNISKCPYHLFEKITLT